MRRAAPPVALVSAILLAAEAGGVEWRLQGRVDLRLLASDAEAVWLDQGLDKLRFGEEDEPVALGAALLDFDARFAPTVSGHLTVAAFEAVDRVDTAIDFTEAYVELAPVPRSALRSRFRIGAFYPPGTLENRDSAWTSPYTLAFSAIDAWYAEELRAVGLEIEIESMGRFRSSANDFALSAAAFRYNDPAGAILAWRGWSVHDRQTGLFERLDLAPLPNFQEDGIYHPVQEPIDEPFVELDGRTGWYVAGEWRRLDRSRLVAIHYDNRGDPTVVERGQWAWWTRFDRIGWHLRPADGTDVVAQALCGSTRMDGFDGPLVDNDFQAASLLVSHGRAAHRATLRYDRFRVLDRDTTPADWNDEEGDAWTAAWLYTPPESWQSRISAGRMLWIAELTHVDSRRAARRLLDGPERVGETALQLALQWRFPG